MTSAPEQGGDAQIRAGTRVRVMAAAGACLVALYALGTAVIPLPRYFPGDQGITLDFVKMLETGWAGDTARYVAFVAAAFALYAVAVTAAWRLRAIPAWLLWAFPVAFAAALVLMYPPTAVDMLHYDADARTLWIHGQNPLVVPPSANPYPIGISWADQPSPYGPWWQMLGGPAVLLAGDDNLAGLVGFKVMAAAFFLGSAWLVWRIVRRTRPGRESLALVLFAWNPLILLATVGNGHNDIAMIFFALVALERAEQRDWNFAFLALTLSVLIKFGTALLGPPLLLFAWYQTPGDWRARTRAVAPALALSAIVAALLYAPFWQGMETFDTLRGEAAKWITSTPVAVRAVLDDFVAFEDAQTAARVLTTALFVAVYLPLTWQARRSFDHLVVAGAAALFAYLVLAVTWFRPWYFLWPLALAALRPRSGLAAVFLVTSFAAAFPSLIEQYRFEVVPADWDDLSAVVVGFGPPVVAWALAAAWTRSWALGAASSEAEATPVPARSAAGFGVEPMGTEESPGS